MTEAENRQIENFLMSVESNLAVTLAAKAAALPDGFQAAKFQQNCIAMLKGLKKADLLAIKVEDVVACLMKAALLDLDFLSGECYAICYFNKEENKKDLNFQTDYKGEDKIAKTYSIKPVLNTIKEVVRQGDVYQKIVKDGSVYFTFEPIPFSNAPIIGAFAQVAFTDGSSIGEEMGKAELDELKKNFSKAPNSPSWTKTPGEMYRKTVLRRVLKNVPKSFKNSAQQIAYSTATDFEFNNQTGVSEKAEEIRNPFLETKNVPQITAQNIQNQPTGLPQSENLKPEYITEPIQSENHVQGHSEASEYLEADVEVIYECTNCAVQINEAENGYSKKMYGRPLCRTCQALAKKGEI